MDPLEAPSNVSGIRAAVQFGTADGVLCNLKPLGKALCRRVRDGKAATGNYLSPV